MKDQCFFIKRPSVNVCYIYVPGDQEHKNWARRFVFSVTHHRPSLDYTFTVICNGPTFDGHDIFAPMGKYHIFHHDDSGWDIGGYLAYAPHCPCDLIYCFGGTSYVKSDDWLERLLEAHSRHGLGLYGTLATFEIRPHINTSGFLCSPHLLAAYPNKVQSKHDRYEFEHGYRAFWMMVARLDLPVLLVTHCGEYNWPHWRLPPNVYRRGNQSNCLTFFRHTDNYDAAEPHTRQFMEYLADTLTDDRFRSWRGLDLPASLREDNVPQAKIGV